MPSPVLTLDVQPNYLIHLRSGLKTHEGRLARPRYLALSRGSHIKIQADPDALEGTPDEANEDSSIFKVKSVTYYKAFEEMLRAKGVEAFLPGRDEQDIKGAVAVYRSFPGYEEGERTLGVVAIEVGLVE